jgi:hypothetical protein
MDQSNNRGIPRGCLSCNRTQENKATTSVLNKQYKLIENIHNSNFMQQNPNWWNSVRAGWHPALETNSAATGQPQSQMIHQSICCSSFISYQQQTTPPSFKHQRSLAVILESKLVQQCPGWHTAVENHCAATGQPKGQNQDEPNC